jgi:flagellar hook-basal body complex protein FliE
MSLEPISFLPADASVSLDSATRPAAVDRSFGSWLQQQVEEVNQQIIDADTEVRKLALGEAENLHQVMMSLEKAKLSFNLVMQVRNKVMEAYQDIMRTQI